MSSDTGSSASTKNRQQRQAAGKALRNSIPRSAHSAWKPSSNRTDIVSLLEESNRDRLPDLIPLRYGRMLKSPLAFLRGSAIVMAEDLATLPTTNLRVQICGDCHLQNFGWFATPERNLIFDVTDFDETRKAPWEWDIKRLAASVVVAARYLNAPKAAQRELGQTVVREYRQRLAQYDLMSPLEMWYVRLDSNIVLNQSSDPSGKKKAQELVDRGRQRTMDSLLPKMTERDKNGHLRFKDRPPLIFHPKDFDKFLENTKSLMSNYRTTLSDERRGLLERYRVVDVASKVVGVGSVGLRCNIVLMLDEDEAPLVLQFKEARASVLEKFVGRSDRTHNGHRIVHGQRLMQAASDMFLGWADGPDGRSYYFRQLRDMKISTETEKLSLPEFEEYVQLCGWALARAHSKAGETSEIAGYLGSGDQFDVALAEFAMSYADQVEQDFQTLVQARKSGRIVAVDESLPEK